MRSRSLKQDIKLHAVYSFELFKSFLPSLCFLGFVYIVGSVSIWSCYQNGETEFSKALIYMYFLLLAEPIFPDAPSHWIVDLVSIIAPLVGIIVVFDLLARFSLHVFSKKTNQREWVNVVVSTYNQHIVLCGLGKVGAKVFEELVSLGELIVCIERDEEARGVRIARDSGHPVIIDDVRDDKVLLAAGIKRAKAVLAITDEDLINLEIALDARKYNQEIRVVARIFEQELGKKISSAFELQGVYSTSTLAASFFAVSSLDPEIINSFYVDDQRFVIVKTIIKESPWLIDQSVGDLMDQHGLSVITCERNQEKLEISNRFTLKQHDKISFQCRYDKFKTYREHHPNAPTAS